MDLTARLASVLGPTLIVVTVSESINLDIWQNVEPAVVYLNGLVFFVSGLGVVTVHARWRPASDAIVTLAGWLLVVAGSIRMVFPTAPQLDPGPVTYGVIAVLFLFGLVLTVRAFVPRRRADTPQHGGNVP